jgi:hypothetical protein
MRASHLIVLVMLLLSSVLLFTDRSTAQSVYGQVWGRLTSASGTPVSGAVVNLISVGTGSRTGAKSNPDGSFAVGNVSADLYQIEVRADGFKRVQATIVVSANSTTTVNVPLQAGDPNTIVGSTATGASVLQLDRTDVSTLFDSRAIAALPLLDRNITNLQLLVPGAARGNLFIPASQNPQQAKPVNINGQHFSGSAFQFDGTENRDPLEGIVVINPTLDSVREMKVTTLGYNAEFGQATAGVVTIQTRSGSNVWHGDAFGDRRTGWGQSTDPFAPAGVPPTKMGIFGGSFGGPIAKNKLFIFGDYQGTRSSQGANLLLNVPSDRVRTTCLGPAGSGMQPYCDLSGYSKFINGTLTDKEGHAFPTINGVPYQIPNSPSNAVHNDPDGYVTDQAAQLLALLPKKGGNTWWNHIPTDSTCAVSNPDDAVCNNYLVSGQEVFNGDRFDVRTDYNASSALRIFGRYSFGDFRDNGMPAFGVVAGGAGTDPTGFSGVARTRNQGIASGFTYSLSSRLLTDVRFGYFRYRLNNDSPDSGNTPHIIPNTFGKDTGDPFATEMPDIQIPGSGGLASSIGSDYLRLGYSIHNNCDCPLREREQQFQFVNNWTRSAGQHILKWGGDLRFLQNYRLASDIPRTGFFGFAPSLTGLGLATFLIGDVTSFERTFSTPAAVNAGERQKRFAFYGQDTWRMNSRLTLNYGLRWEVYFPQSVTGAGSGGFLIPNFNSHDPASTFFNVATGSDTNGGIAISLKTFAPRLGIAYLVNPSTVIRAGYGRSFDAGYAGSLFGIAATQNPPVTVTQNLQSGGFNLATGPPQFVFPAGPHFSLLDLAAANIGAPNQTPALSASGAILYALPSQVRVPTVDSWNLTVQHELASGLYFELGYVGNKGTHVFTDSGVGTYYDLNQTSLQNSIAKVTIVNNKAPSFCRKNSIFIYPNSAYCFVMPAFRGFYDNVSITQPPKCRPTAPCFFNPTIFEVRYFGNNASDNYNALQGKLQKNFNHGYSLMAHYTWSKGLDYDSNYFRVDPRIGYGPDRFDLAHRFVLTNIWNLPIGRGKTWFGGVGPAADRFVGGWTLSAITVWRSGFPFTPTYKDCQLDVDPSSPCRPNRVGLVTVGGGRDQYFLTTGGKELGGNDCISGTKFCGVDANGNPVPGNAIGPWQRPAIGQIGTAGRNSLRGPGFFQSDIGVAKTVFMTERASLAFRADVFNAFNKVNLGNPNPCVDCSNNGVITGGVISSLDPGAMQREFQFSVQIQF